PVRPPPIEPASSNLSSVDTFLLAPGLRLLQRTAGGSVTLFLLSALAIAVLAARDVVLETSGRFPALDVRAALPARTDDHDARLDHRGGPPSSPLDTFIRSNETQVAFSSQYRPQRLHCTTHGVRSFSFGIRHRPVQGLI